MPNKNVLAIVCGVAALGLLAFAIYSHGDPLPIMGATAAALGFVTWGVAHPGRKTPLSIMAIAAGSGGLFFHFDSFWGLVVCVLSFVWALVGLLPVMDGAWRLKLGFIAAVFLGGVVALWPSASSWSGGKLPLPAYFRDRIGFAIAPGLDLRGGLRLVYTVEVEEAIRDKRDHYADDMRQQLATTFGLHSGEGRVTRDELSKLDEKVHVAQPEAAIIRLTFKDPADKAKLDDRFNKAFSTELPRPPARAPTRSRSRSARDVESQIRDRAVAQAKDTVSAASTSSACARPPSRRATRTSSSRSRAATRRASRDIKDIIRTTARLEFKMVDDGGSEKVFGPPALKADDMPEGEGIAQYTEGAPDGVDGSGHKKQPSRRYYARMSCQPPKYPTETMTECLARFKGWTATLSVPDDHVIGFEAVTEPVEGTEPLQFKQVGWRTVYMYARAELTGDYITDAITARTSRTSARYYVLLSLLARRGRPVRGGHGRERQPPLRHHPRRHRRLGARHQAEDRRRQGAPSPWAPATRRSSCTTRSSSSSCSARARCRRRSRRATSRSSARRSAATRSSRRCAGRSSGPPRLLLHARLLPQVGHRRRRGRAVQPHAAARGPRDASARR